MGVQAAKQSVVECKECFYSENSDLNIVGKIVLLPVILIFCVSVVLLDLLFTSDKRR